MFTIYIAYTKSSKKKNVYKIGQISSGLPNSVEKRIKSINAMSFENVAILLALESPCMDKYIHSKLLASKDYKKIKGEWVKVPSQEQMIKDINVIISDYKEVRESHYISINEFSKRNITLRNQEVFLDADVALLFKTTSANVNKVKNRNENELRGLYFKLEDQEWKQVLELRKRPYVGGHRPTVYTKEGVYALFLSMNKKSQLEFAGKDVLSL